MEYITDTTPQPLTSWLTEYVLGCPGHIVWVKVVAYRSEREPTVAGPKPYGLAAAVDVRRDRIYHSSVPVLRIRSLGHTRSERGG